MSLSSSELQSGSESIDNKNYRFFVGGNDLEMSEIRKLLIENKLNVSDNSLGWGAKSSAYRELITDSIQRGEVPVMIELEQDVELPEDANTIVIDHHGKRSSEPASILQICKLLNIEPTRRIELIAANDAGWIPKLRAIGATSEEIRAIRAEDRKAQGFDEELEQLSVKLAEKAKIITGLGLAIADNLPITRFAGIKDWIATELGIYNIVSIAQPQKAGENGEMEFQGDGQICAELSSRYNGWSGGDGLGKVGGTAFWGGYPEKPEEVVELIKSKLVHDDNRPEMSIGTSTQYSTKDAERDIVKLNSDAPLSEIRRIVESLTPRDQIKFFNTMTMDPIRTLRPSGQKGRADLSRNAPLAAKMIVEIREKRVTPFEAVTKHISKNLPIALASEAVSANLKGRAPGESGYSSAEIKNDSDIKAFSDVLYKIDALSELMLFKGMITRREETQEVRDLSDGGEGKGLIYRRGTGRYWYRLEVPVREEIVRFKLGPDEEPTNKEFDESPETWLSTIEQTCTELTSEKIQETLDKAIGKLRPWVKSEALREATKERISLFQNLAAKAKENIQQYTQLLQQNKKAFGSPTTIQDWETEKAEFIELMDTIGKGFKGARIISESGKEKVIESAYRNYDEATVVRWFKMFKEITYPFWFTDKMDRQRTKNCIPNNGYTPKGLVNLREIELDLLKL